MAFVFLLACVFVWVSGACLSSLIGLRVGFSVFLFTFCFRCCLDWWSSCVQWLAWLLGLTMTMTVWILLFGLLYGGNLLSRIMSMHCIQVVRGRRIEHFRKSKYKKAKPIDFCACDTNSVIGSLCILVPRTNSCTHSTPRFYPDTVHLLIPATKDENSNCFQKKSQGCGSCEFAIFL